MANATQPLVGRSVGHEWPVFVATSGHFYWPPTGSSYWPLTTKNAFLENLHVDELFVRFRDAFESLEGFSEVTRLGTSWRKHSARPVYLEAELVDEVEVKRAPRTPSAQASPPSTAAQKGDRAPAI
jgi:hypothetical protein